MDRGKVEITSTKRHLAVRIGRAIESAHKGVLGIMRGQEDLLVRVYWEWED